MPRVKAQVRCSEPVLARRTEQEAACRRPRSDGGDADELVLLVAPSQVAGATWLSRPVADRYARTASGQFSASAARLPHMTAAPARMLGAAASVARSRSSPPGRP